MANNPLTGIGYVLQGLKLIFQPGLKRYLIVPLLVNILVFTVVGWIGYSQFDVLLDRFLPADSWLSYLSWILWPLFAITLILITFYTFTVFANLLAAPFNGKLAEKVEELLTGSLPDGTSGSIAADVLPSILSELRKIAYFLLRAIPLLLLFLIPVLNVAAPFLWIAFSAWFLSLEYVDYPMGNHGFKFNTLKASMKKIRLTALGFGGGVTLLMLIPVVNFLAMPAAVAGATALWCNQKERLQP
ncbi:MAG: sulfate transporter CysZ [Gammaproteobacteria bacterium]|nr:sulfate transporter CysZ [Gammaproteobacteria bacterium]